MLYISARIEYEPKSVGVYTANVLFAEQEIPTSPYKINVEPNIDVSKVKVKGLEPSKSIPSVASTVDALLLIHTVLYVTLLDLVFNFSPT